MMIKSIIDSLSHCLLPENSIYYLSLIDEVLLENYLNIRFRNWHDCPRVSTFFWNFRC
jgi:hypothetical protein